MPTDHRTNHRKSLKENIASTTAFVSTMTYPLKKNMTTTALRCLERCTWALTRGGAWASAPSTSLASMPGRAAQQQLGGDQP